MEAWEVRPAEAIGPIRLGMTRAEVRETMGEEGEGGDGEEVWFADMKLRAAFDADDRVEFVEATSDATVRFGDLEPFALDRDDVVARVAEMLGEEGDVREQGEAVRFEAHGLVFWGHNQRSEDERGFETVAVYEPGYYERS